jgi:lipid II:glycine glycyltransferase (peptidoglycan interpeptide bridge formation enzyme)
MFHDRVTNWLPFYWAGFSSTTRYSYIIDPIENVDAVWGGFTDKTRNAVRRASRELTVDADRPAHEFLPLLTRTFDRKEMAVPVDLSVTARLIDACRSRNAGSLLFASDSTGRTHAGLFLAWDSDTAYYLLGATDPEHRTTGAMSLLVWEAIQVASRVSRRFDFEGSMLEPVERFVRGFGGRQVPYFDVTGASSRMQAALATRALFRALRPRT